MIPSATRATLLLLLTLSACGPKSRGASTGPSSPSDPSSPTDTNPIQAETPTPVPSPTVEPTPEPTATPVPSPTATPSPSPTVTPSPTVEPTPTATATPSPSPQPNFSVNPQYYDFGEVAVTAGSKEQKFSFSNHGDSMSGCKAVLSNAHDFIVTSDCDLNLNGSEKKCDVNVVGAPSTAGSKSGSVYLTCPGGSISDVATLATKGITPVVGPFIALTNPWFAPTTVRDAAPQNGSAFVTFYNQSSVTLTGCEAPRVNDPTGTFSIRKSGTTCGASPLSPWQSCTIAVDATPQMAGEIYAVVSFNCPLYGRYTSPAIHITGWSPPRILWTKNNAVPSTNESTIDLGSFSKGSWPGGVKIYSFNLGDTNAVNCKYTYSGDTSAFPNSGAAYASVIYSGQGPEVFFNFGSQYTSRIGTYSETVTVSCDRGVTASTTISYRVH